MRLRTKLVYLDTNAISSLFQEAPERPGSLLASWRAQLVFHVRRGAVMTVVSLYAFQELAPLHRKLKRYTAYDLGLMVRNARGARVKPSDAHDHHHYVAASYTDLLVTDDAEFRDTVKMIDSRLRAVSVHEFFGRTCGPVVSIP